MYSNFYFLMGCAVAALILGITIWRKSRRLRKREEKPMKLLQNLFTERDDPNKLCLRRIIGTIGFVVCVFALFHPGVNSDDFKTLTLVVAGLLGSTTVDGFSKGKGGGGNGES
jgi:cytochrome c oxidase assembly factor CtaG